MIKTNVTRLLAAAQVPHEALAFDVEEDDLSGEHAADALGASPDQVFKTLVLRGERTGLFVCCVPCRETVDLKKAARAVGDKRAEMLPMKDLLGATGYIRGGCSPIGMKRKYPLFVDETCSLERYIIISAGVRGVMVRIAPGDLLRYTGAEVADLTET